MPTVELRNENEKKIIVTFRNHQVPNEEKTKAAGRPIFDDMEVCDIHFPGNSKVWGCFPAEEVEPNFTRELHRPVTYKEAFADQYARFQAALPQTVAGTPISELPFLTEGKRMELRAVHIHTAEQLAALEGANLAALGMGGREWKTQAIAYLENATGSAKVTSMALEIERLKRLVEGMQAGAGGAALLDKPLDQQSDAELKSYIKEKTGEAPRGNVSRETLLSRAAELAEKKPEAVGD
jgi:hypothetical protein